MRNKSKPASFYSPGTSSSSSSMSPVAGFEPSPPNPEDDTDVASFFKLAKLSAPSWFKIPGNISVISEKGRNNGLKMAVSRPSISKSMTTGVFMLH